MDAYEATRIVFSRIQSLDPENAPKIMGLLLIQDHGEKEMIRLAFGPEALVHSIVIKARKELGLVQSTPSTPSTPSPSSPSNFLPTTRQSSSRLLGFNLPSSLSIPSPSSWAPPGPFSRTNTEDFQNPDELISPNSSSYAPVNGMNMGSSFYGDLIDELQIQDQLSFLNDGAAGPKTNDLFYADMAAANEVRSPSSTSEGMLFPYGNWGGNGHRRSCSVADICLGSEAAASGFGWKPCLYFARGYCKNGNSCRFLHGLPETDTMAGKIDAVEQCQELLRSKSQRLGSASQLMASASFPYASTGKCMNFLLQQQQNDSQRVAAAAAALMLGDDSQKFARSRMERTEFSTGGGMVNPGARQIYLTFPADSTFREEDVSNYFSIYGPVQDVRIPYQQKRMFGFVTFVYPETVKLILAKGNPHFVCDARVLVKPYKEKGKVPDKKQQQQQQLERGEFSACSTPTGLDSRDPFDLQLGARMFYNSHDAIIRRKEQADLQQAIELQGRRLMDLHLLDVKKRNLSGSIGSPNQVINQAAILSDGSSPDSTEENCLNHAATVSTAADPQQQLLNHDVFQMVSIKCDNEFTANDIAIKESTKEESEFQDSVDHNLPDSPFASPTKSVGDPSSIFLASAEAEKSASSSNNLITSTLYPATSTLDTSFKSCFFQMPRFSSGHGAIGM
eukprot:TRINITY_DN10888_c0_g1_i2.p1 TRINITY_DN10888_c0_g1~~TRINITY_DN10888_c0_g1_i2.p1  ORF type:complete len:690 (+),score=98.12 TRINITY_DN10888_c0_g1_i2:43-2070(+)